MEISRVPGYELADLLRGEIFRLYGSRVAADMFLDARHALLGGRAPAEILAQADAGSEIAIEQCRTLAGIVGRLKHGTAV